MFGTIRKHQQWLWILIIAATIVSFVAFFNPAQSSMSGLLGGGLEHGRINGKPISQETLQTFGRQAELFARLQFGEGRIPPGFDVNNAAIQRLFIDAKLKEYGITVSDEAVADWIRQTLPKDPKTGVVNYDAFVENVLKRMNYSEAEFHEFVRQEVGLQQLREVVGVGGELVTPREAEEEFRHANEQAVTGAAFFSSSNYTASVSLDAAAIAQFFTNRIADYRVPERTVISYVRWSSAPYLTNAEAALAKIPDLAARLESNYQQRGADAFRDKDGNVLAKPAALISLRQQVVEGQALAEAARVARDFANELYAMEPAKPENLSTLATKYGLAVQLSAPFSEFERVPGLEEVPALQREAVRLAPDQPFTKPVESAQAVYLGALVRRVPSTLPALDTVRARVTADYRRTKALEAAHTAGEAFATAVSTALAQGKTFEAAAADQNVKVTELAPFSLATQSLPGLDARVNLALLKDTAFSLKPGTASRFVQAGDGGFVLFLKERRPVDAALVKAGLNGYLEEQRNQRKEEAFGAWFQAEFKKSGLEELLKKKGDAAL
ncbi:MAG TPA: SurA N-terminal domain-containing protein [Candidatus Limnocylindria bacterium]|nr:SurA N-terminal domain-containing protein [Candidatus Limnocylindria bacterium]